jgi:hypothetical protein
MGRPSGPSVTPPSAHARCPLPVDNHEVQTTVIRPAAIIPAGAGYRIMRALTEADVSRGGVWNATAALWQRYDLAWDGPGGSRGTSQLIGTICVAYDTPARYLITIYRVSLIDEAARLGWTTERLCDDALRYGGLSLATCPRAELGPPPASDPFHANVPQQRRPVVLAVPPQ